MMLPPGPGEGDGSSQDPMQDYHAHLLNHPNVVLHGINFSTGTTTAPALPTSTQGRRGRMCLPQAAAGAAAALPWPRRCQLPYCYTMVASVQLVGRVTPNPTRLPSLTLTEKDLRVSSLGGAPYSEGGGRVYFAGLTFKNVTSGDAVRGEKPSAPRSSDVDITTLGGYLAAAARVEGARIVQVHPAFSGLEVMQRLLEWKPSQPNVVCVSSQGLLARPLGALPGQYVDPTVTPQLIAFGGAARDKVCGLCVCGA